jgi:hypothetical protein
MPELNEGLAFNRAPAGVRAAFVGGTARRTRLPAGTGLYKFTAFDLYPVGRDGTGSAGRPVSPWWCRVDPDPAAGDRGLDGFLADAAAAGLPPAEYARRALAVMFAWNGLTLPGTGLLRVQRVRLLVPVYAFAGRCQRMPNDRAPLYRPPAGAPALAGGAIQLWIPNLTADHVLATGVNLIG